MKLECPRNSRNISMVLLRVEGDKAFPPDQWQFERFSLFNSPLVWALFFDQGRAGNFTESACYSSQKLAGWKGLRDSIHEISRREAVRALSI